MTELPIHCPFCGKTKVNDLLRSRMEEFRRRIVTEIRMKERLNASGTRLNFSDWNDAISHVAHAVDGVKP